MKPEMVSNKDLKVLISHGEELGFHSKCNVKPLEVCVCACARACEGAGICSDLHLERIILGALWRTDCVGLWSVKGEVEEGPLRATQSLSQSVTLLDYPRIHTCKTRLHPRNLEL